MCAIEGKITRSFQMAQSFEFAVQSALVIGLKEKKSRVIFVRFGVISGAENRAEAPVVLQFIAGL